MKSLAEYCQGHGCFEFRLEQIRAVNDGPAVENGVELGHELPCLRQRHRVMEPLTSFVCSQSKAINAQSSALIGFGVGLITFRKFVIRSSTFKTFCGRGLVNADEQLP
jgi:hypothetical protein